MEIMLAVLLVLVLVIQIVILVKASKKKEDKTEAVLDLVKDMQKDQNSLKIDVIKEISEGSAKNQDTIRRSLIEMQESTEKRLLANSKNVNDSIVGGLKSIQEATDRKLTDIQHKAWCYSHPRATGGAHRCTSIQKDFRFGTPKVLRHYPRDCPLP